MSDIFLSYKIMLLLTVIFHPKECYRYLAFYCSLVYFIIGNIKLYWFYSDNTWFLWQMLSELLVVGLFYYFTQGITRWVAILTLLLLVFLNLHQYYGWYKGSLFYDSFLPTVDYIYWNRWGFEVILFTLWFREEVFTCIKKRWTFENLTMVYIIGWIVYLAGNY